MMSVDDSAEIKGSSLDELNKLPQSGFEHAHAALTAAIEQGYIDLKNVHKILDFGAGYGGSTSAIVDVTRQYAPHIDAVENGEVVLKNLIPSGVLPRENIIPYDGILYLKELRQKGIAPYDLITAFRLGSDTMGRIFREIASSTTTTLNPNGNLLVTSDNLSMSVALKALDEAGVTYHFIEQITEGKRIVLPHILIVPQASCIKIKPLDIPASLLK